MLNFSFLLVAAIVASTYANPVKCHPTDGLVDLGYAQHVPTYVNQTISGHKVTIYKNIRFANAPTGNLRFRAPDIKLPRVNGVQDGKVPWGSTDCISSAPGYVPFPDINGTTWGREDCLFLDVYVPDGVKPGDDVPVLHFFFGSAYAFGSKEIMFSPMGLFDRMFQDHAGKFLFVANNYRLGIPGWTHAQGEDMDGNIGMLDCLAAAKWTMKYINKFGGNGQRITVVGQSAGAGILVIACSTSEKKCYQATKEIVRPGAQDCELHKLAVSKICPEKKILAVNNELINNVVSESGGGQLGALHGFGPAPDGKIIPDLPLAMLQRGQFYKGLKGLIIGSMALEGMGTSHDTGLPGYFPILVRQQMLSASNETVKILQNEYYDANELPKMAWDWTTDVVFACTGNNLANAMPNIAQRYIMSTPPAVHGQDLQYFFNNEDIVPVNDTELVIGFQRRLLKFVSGKRLNWPAWGSSKGMYNITDKFEATTLPEKLRRRCDLLNQFILDPANGA